MPETLRESRRTGLFSKLPRAGEVKTRLCPPLAPEEAALLAEAMLLDVAERLSVAGSFHTVLCHAPAGEEGWFRENLPWLVERHAQVGDGLGQRLANFFEASLEVDTIQSVVVVGSDCPQLPVESVSEAHDRLARGADLVLGPDLGGGYYLVGLAGACPGLFTDVRMSTEDMCARTAELARERGLLVEFLEPLGDVDQEPDLMRLASALGDSGAGPEVPMRTAATLRALLSIPS